MVGLESDLEDLASGVGAAGVLVRGFLDGVVVEGPSSSKSNATLLIGISYEVFFNADLGAVVDGVGVVDGLEDLVVMGWAPKETLVSVLACGCVVGVNGCVVGSVRLIAADLAMLDWTILLRKSVLGLGAVVVVVVLSECPTTVKREEDMLVVWL